MSKSTKTALVTGANAGLGFETAAQLAEAGWGDVILACRSQKKGDDARARLVERVGSDPFSVLVIDTSEVDASLRAADELKTDGRTIDFLLLNAGASGSEARFNADGVEVTYASTLIGHHALTMQALNHGLLSADARIVIAGSEGARGNLPGMKVHDVRSIAAKHFDGDVVETIVQLVQLKTPAQTKFVNMDEYVTAKLLVAWWATALSRRLPRGMVVNAVSPGAALETSFARDAPAFLRYTMMPVMKLVGPLLGMNGPIADGARRYIAAADFDDSGRFHATAHKKKLVGPMGVQTWPEYFADEDAQEATFEALVQLTDSAPKGLKAVA